MSQHADMRATQARAPGAYNIEEVRTLLDGADVSVGHLADILCAARALTGESRAYEDCALSLQLLHIALGQARDRFCPEGGRHGHVHEVHRSGR